MTEKIIEIRTMITDNVRYLDYSDYERRLQMIEMRGRLLELRYNHNHDEKGRFCSGGGGGRMSSSSEKRLYSNGGANPNKSIDKSEKSDIINSDNNCEELRTAIENRTVSTRLDKKAQSAHKFGSDEYKKRVANGEIPSYTEYSNMEIQTIINQKSCTGKVYKGKDGQFREIISLDDKSGMFGDRITKKYIPTNRATIHYSKKGTHLVPAPPKEGE